MRLQKTVAIVTGGGSGMGAAIAETYAREGAHVAVVDVDGAAAKKVAAKIGNAAMALQCDVTKRSDIDAAVVETASKFGGLNVLVNNAGVAHANRPMLEIGEKEFDRVFAVNVKGLFMFTQAVVPLIRGKGLKGVTGGVIINIGSTAGIRPRPGLSAYNATKGADHNLTKTLAVQLAPDKIRVCAIAPVATDTPLLPTFLGPAPGMREKFIATVPLGRLATAQDIADAALFLASDEAKFLTGNILEVDGGRCV